jgi:hypothetical protein
MSSPLERLRHHASGAIARGEGTAIAGQPAMLYPYTTQPTPYGLLPAYRHVGLGGMVTFIFMPRDGRCDVETYSADLSEMWGCGNYRESDIATILDIVAPC